MRTADAHSETPIAVHTDLDAIFFSLELSRSTWLITALAPDGEGKMSKHQIHSGDIAVGPLCSGT